MMPPEPPGLAFRANTFEEPISVATEPSTADLMLSFPILIEDPPAQHFVAYGSTGNEVWKYHSNGCRQVQLSYISPVTCAIYFKQTPEPGMTIITGPQVSLSWDPSPDSNVVGYAIYSGTNSGDYPVRTDSGAATNVTVKNLTATSWYFIATAYTAEGLESLPSNEVSAPLPLVATGSVLLLPDYMRISQQLTAGTGTVTLPLVRSDTGFFELRPF